MIWEQQGFLTSRGDKIKNGLYVQELLDVTLLPGTLAIIKVQEHSKNDSLEAKENHLADTSKKNVILKGTNNETSVMFQRDVLLNDNLEKLTRCPTISPGKGKTILAI